MTARTTTTTQSSLSIPQTQNTAPVLEFACLYTHDIRRKQKRWQDGFLRFHTFNKRVMVYDVPRNFIGDTHWKEDAAVQEGDEVTLEKDGVLVQVAEGVGRTETDLTELVGKRGKGRNKGSSEVGSSSPVKGPPVTPGLRGGTMSTMQKQGNTQLKHRSLNALLGTPKAPIGKAAFPARSPYEERTANVENEQWEDGRPPKRQRLEQAQGWNATRATKTPAAAQKKETPLWARTADAAKQKQKKKASVADGRQRLDTREIIELSDDEDASESQEPSFLPGFSSDVLAPPSSPAKECSAVKVRPVKKSTTATETLSIERQQRNERQSVVRQAAGDKTGVRDAAAIDLSHGAAAGNVEAPEERTIIIPNTGRDTEPLQTTKASIRPEREDDEGRPVGKTLRMASRSSKKKVLLCQDRLAKKPSRVYSTNTENAIGGLLNATSEDDAPSRPEAKSQRKLREERLAKIQRKSAPAAAEQPPSRSRDAGPEPTHVRAEHPCSEKAQGRPGQDIQDGATTLADLDSMIMPTNEPASSPLPENAMAPPPKKDRSLRKVASEVARPAAQRRAPGAPMRFTPSPSKRASAAPAPSTMKETAQPAAPPSKSRVKQPIQRSVSLNTTPDGTSAVILSKPFQTPKAPQPAKAVVAEKAPDPWSREAFDLFEWRPPGWVEEEWMRGTEGG